MNKPIVTRTGYAMLTQDQLLDEIQRLEGLVASVTGDGKTFPCPIGVTMRLRGGGSGIGGQAVTSCPLCGAVSSNTAMRSHQPIETAALVKRVAATEELVEMHAPGADLVGVYLGLERQVKDRTAERDEARDLCVRSGYWVSAQDDESTFTHVKETPAGWSNRIRPSAYDMPVGSVVVTVEHTYTRMFTDAGSHGWAREKDRPATIQSGWIEGLFSDGLVTEWRLPQLQRDVEIQRAP